jgi:hypothetical protein
MTTIDNTCPGCGAERGYPDPPLDFPNRAKVDNDWMCNNPACPTGFQDPASAGLAPRAHENVATLPAVSRWVSKRTGPGMTTSRCIPVDAPCPEGWTEGGVF